VKLGRPAFAAALLVSAWLPARPGASAGAPVAAVPDYDEETWEELIELPGSEDLVADWLTAEDEEPDLSAGQAAAPAPSATVFVAPVAQSSSTTITTPESR
jgi:hypothetical protein